MSQLKTFYVICTLHNQQAPLFHAIGTQAVNADYAEENIKRLRNDATVIGVVGGANAASEEEALRVFFADEEDGGPITRKEELVVYGFIAVGLVTLTALIYALVSY